MRTEEYWLGRIWKPEGRMPTKLVSTMRATDRTKTTNEIALLFSKKSGMDEDVSVLRMRFFGKDF